MMRLYSGTACPYSHRCRIVLFEKGMDFEVVDVDLMHKSEDVAAINPYNRVPVLVDRDLVLYESNIINEYIDERFPHPQLMPPDPVIRGRTRLLLFGFEKELYSQVDLLESGVSGKAADAARAAIRNQLTQLSQLLIKQKFLLQDEFSMLDVAIAPLLWRLEHYGIQLGKDAAPLMKYAERLFSRQGFIDALTSTERAMRK
ncbi:MAG: glutathione S-transferase N-terminal domain-containing protein [Pseudomonadota bacterium]